MFNIFILIDVIIVTSNVILLLSLLWLLCFQHCKHYHWHVLSSLYFTVIMLAKIVNMIVLLLFLLLLLLQFAIMHNVLKMFQLFL